MQDAQSFFPEDFYLQRLSAIRGISFTRREIDVMACLLSARKTSKIAYFLSIDPRTVETYIRNITLKLECNTQEGIIDFLELSDKVPFLRKHYFHLQIESAFEKSLKDLSKLISNEGPINIVVNRGHHIQSPLVLLLKIHLKLVGVRILDHRDTQESSHLIYVLPPRLQDVSFSFLQRYAKNKILLLLAAGQKNRELPKQFKGLETMSITKNKNYYFYFFSIVKNIFPKIKIDNIIENFNEKYKKINDVMKAEYFKNNLSPPRKEELHFLERVNCIIPLSKRFIAVVLCFVFLISMCFLGVYWSIENKHPVALSELPIPVESAFLERPELLSEIKKSFENKSGIQAVAIVGIGGAGKTTLARQYARQQKSQIIWEINAETQESLKYSFEKLAHHLAKTETDETLLRVIQKIKNPTLREEKILLFVINHLKSQENWLLIYDNVEHFADIQKYFPQNDKLWGQGKVILTTRNINIQNSTLVNHVIVMGELTPEAMLTLFTKIMSHGSSHPFPLKKAETIAFLKNIPPFPLDVSVSSYYLKSTNLSYNEFLKNVDEYNKNFEDEQKNILKDFGSYNKTRYSIITLSIKKLMNVDKNYGDLLFFISLLDSQNIPRNLLNVYKNKHVVDNFIYNLKKYSLITTNNISDHFHESQNFNIHRSTQGIILNYLSKELNVKENPQMMQSITAALEKYMDATIQALDYASMGVLINHGERFLSHTNLLTGSMRDIIGVPLGYIYVYKYYILKAKKIIERSLKNLKTNMNENFYRVSQALSSLSAVYWELEGNYEKIKNLLEQSLGLLKKYSAEDSPCCAEILVQLGHTYRELGSYEKASKHLQKSLIIYKRHYGETHLRYASSLACLGGVYSESGEYEKAAELLDKSLVLFKNTSPQQNNWICLTLTFLGFTYVKLGHYEKGMDLLNQALIYGNKFYPKDHYPIAFIGAIQGIAHGELGNFKKAKNLFEKALAVYREHFGQDHFEIARLLRDLSRVYFLEGDLETSEDLLKRALKIFQRHKHPEIYSCLESLADLYLKKSLQASTNKELEQAQIFKTQAIDYLRKALDVLKEKFPEDSPYKIRIEHKIAKLEQG